MHVREARRGRKAAPWKSGPFITENTAVQRPAGEGAQRGVAWRAWVAESAVYGRSGCFRLNFSEFSRFPSEMAPLAGSSSGGYRLSRHLPWLAVSRLFPWLSGGYSHHREHHFPGGPLPGGTYYHERCSSKERLLAERSGLAFPVCVAELHALDLRWLAGSTTSHTRLPVASSTSFGGFQTDCQSTSKMKK